MASSPITSWQIGGKKVEAVTDYLFLGSKITEDDDCSHEIRRRLLFGRKAMTNLDCVEKQRHHSVNKGPCSQGYGLLSGHIWLGELDCTKSQTRLSDFHLPFPGSSAGIKSTLNAGDPGSIPGSGRSPGEGIGYPLQYSWSSLMAQTVKNLPAMLETWF